MTRHPTASRLFRGARDLSALALAAVLLSSAAPHPAAAQGASVTEGLLTTFGLVAPTPPDIDYRERAPLVVPQTTDILPPPRSDDDLAANPAWPKDADEERRKREAEAEKGLGAAFFEGRQLTPAELAKGQSNAKVGGSGFGGTRRNADNKLSPNQLEFKGWGSLTAGEKPIVFDGEPERSALVQPPPGYQTPAPNAPYGTVEKKKEAWSLPNWFDRTTPKD